MSEKHASSDKKYDELLALFKANEKFPLRFVHKFIGRNTEEFLKGVQIWHERYLHLKETVRRVSADGHYLALTYEFNADSAEEIIDVLKSTAEIPGIKMVL